MNEQAIRATTPSALRGRGTGIIVCAIFAALWANWARSTFPGTHRLYGWIAIFAVAAISGTLLVAGVATLRQARRLPRATGNGAAAPRGIRRKFVLVLVGEIVALNIAAYFLIGHHMAQYLAPAVAVVVGLHFLPLAKLFRAPHFFATVTVMTLAGMLAAVAMAGGSPATTANGIAELACAIALWATGFISWSRIRRDIAGRHAIAVATDPAH
jgi:hypothetical protein